MGKFLIYLPATSDHQLFGIEAELDQWYEYQQVRLTEQQQSSGDQILGESIKKVTLAAENRLSTKKTRLESIKRENNRNLIARIANLKQLGLVKEE
mgnify:FL=1